MLILPSSHTLAVCLRCSRRLCLWWAYGIYWKKLWNPYYEICNCTTRSIVYPYYFYRPTISIVWKFQLVWKLDFRTISNHNPYTIYIVRILKKNPVYEKTHCLFVTGVTSNHRLIGGMPGMLTRKLRIDRDATTWKIQGELRRFERRPINSNFFLLWVLHTLA
jgi:hypothetical protein